MQSAERIDVHQLPSGAVLDVETQNRRYLIECLGGSAVRISGHPDYCPTPVPAVLSGSVDKQGELERGFIGCGMRLVFFLDERRPITTTRIHSLRFVH